MNLYIKYSPLLYIWNTRISHEWGKKFEGWALVFNIFWYLFYSIGIRSFTIIYLFLIKTINFSQLIEALILYVYIFILFTIFYEIGYLHNDYAAKNEKNPVIRILEKVPNNFYIIQIIIRIITWILLMIPLFIINKTIWIILTCVILLTLIIYLIHNLIRNYFYNFMTMILLRFMKFSLIMIIIYFLLWTFNSEFYLYLSILYLMFQYFDNIYIYNWRMWWNNVLPSWLWKYCYLMISCFIMFTFSLNWIFLTYAILYFWLFIALTPKKMFILKNNR